MREKCLPKSIALGLLAVTFAAFGTIGSMGQQASAADQPITFPFEEHLVFDAASGAVMGDASGVPYLSSHTDESVIGGFIFSLTKETIFAYKGYAKEADNGLTDWCAPIYFFEQDTLDYVTHNCQSSYSDDWEHLATLPTGDYVMYVGDDGFYSNNSVDYEVDITIRAIEDSPDSLSAELASVSGQPIPGISELEGPICMLEDGSSLVIDQDECWNTYNGWANFYRASITVPYEIDSIVLADFVSTSSYASLYVADNWDAFWSWDTDDFLGDTPISLVVGEAKTFYVEKYNSFSDNYIAYALTINRSPENIDDDSVGTPNTGTTALDDSSSVVASIIPVATVATLIGMVLLAVKRSRRAPTQS